MPQLCSSGQPTARLSTARLSTARLDRGWRSLYRCTDNVRTRVPTVTAPVTDPRPVARTPKSARVEVRVSADQKRMFEEAAALTEQTVSEFVTASARSAAQVILADRTRFTLRPDQWTAFVDAIERAPRRLPQLAALLAEPSVLEGE